MRTAASKGGTTEFIDIEHYLDLGNVKFENNGKLKFHVRDLVNQELIELSGGDKLWPVNDDREIVGTAIYLKNAKVRLTAKGDQELKNYSRGVTVLIFQVLIFLVGTTSLGILIYINFLQ